MNEKIFSWPSDNKNTLIEVLLLDSGQTLCISAANGRINCLNIEIMERDMKEYFDQHFAKGDGEYLFESQWVEPDYGPYGELENEGYFLLKFLDYRPIPSE